MLKVTRHAFYNVIISGFLILLMVQVQPIQVYGKNDPVTQAPVVLSNTEQILLRDVLDKIRRYRLDQAILHLEKITREHPKFKLAHLIYADLLMAKARVIRGFGHLSSNSSDELVGLLDEARKRWQHFLSQPPVNALPVHLMQLDSGARSAILVDLSTARLYLFDNRQGVPTLIKDYYVSIGKKGAPKEVQDDQRTPVGVYFVTERLAAENLPDRYGDGAFPINYPNAWDRVRGKTGYGIWLHGTPFSTFSRPPLASDGCVTLSNDDFNEIAPFVDIGQTPVIITNRKIKWLDIQQWRKQREASLDLIKQWQKDWQSLDTDRYLSHYSKSFRSGKMNYKSWSQRKRLVNQSKTYIKVKLSDVSLFKSDDDQNMMVVTFQQAYESSNYKNQSKKRLYWKQEEDGIWRIVFEGSA